MPLTYMYIYMRHLRHLFEIIVGIRKCQLQFLRFFLRIVVVLFVSHVCHNFRFVESLLYDLVNERSIDHTIRRPKFRIKTMLRSPFMRTKIFVIIFSFLFV